MSISIEYNTNQDLCFYGRSLKEFCVDSTSSGGPAYVYSLGAVRARIQEFSANLQTALPRFQMHYAMKANHHHEILSVIKQQGLGIDVVSGGELKRAMDAGFEPDQVVFSGVGKTVSEIRMALKNKLRQINVESTRELLRISEIADEMNLVADVCLRINPNVNPETHPYIATGFRENKFGIDESDLKEALQIVKSKAGLNLMGLSVHIGSQLLGFAALSDALKLVKRIYLDLVAQGFALRCLDVGGGVGIYYESNAEQDSAVLSQYTQVLKKELWDFPGLVQFEPGRVFVARAGVLLTQIQYIKRTQHKNFVIVDTGMHHLMRPALYQAYHRILPVLRRKGEVLRADVVGPVCESSDFLGKEREFSLLKEGDWLAILDVGAYGAVMANGYNSFAPPRFVFF